MPGSYSGGPYGASAGTTVNFNQRSDSFHEAYGVGGHSHDATRYRDAGPPHYSGGGTYTSGPAAAGALAGMTGRAEQQQFGGKRGDGKLSCQMGKMNLGGGKPLKHQNVMHSTRRDEDGDSEEEGEEEEEGGEEEGGDEEEDAEEGEDVKEDEENDEEDEEDEEAEEEAEDEEAEREAEEEEEEEDAESEGEEEEDSEDGSEESEEQSGSEEDEDSD